MSSCPSTPPPAQRPVNAPPIKLERDLARIVFDLCRPNLGIQARRALLARKAAVERRIEFSKRGPSECSKKIEF